MPFDSSKAVGNGLTGAAIGAKAGSFIPIIGPIIGGAVGGASGFFTGFSRDPKKKEMKAQKKIDKKAKKYLKKYGKYPNGYDPQQVSLPQGSTSVPENGTSATTPAGNDQETGFQLSPNIYEPNQQEAFNYLLSKGRSQLENPYEGFEPIEQHARTKFQSESLPSIAERFSALGGSDTRYSSDLVGALGGAQSEFDQGIAALRSQYGLDNQSRALDYLRTGLTPQRETQYIPRQLPIHVPSTTEQLFQAGGDLLRNYVSGGGDLGISNVLSQRKQQQQQESTVNRILNQRNIGSLAKDIAGRGVKPDQINTFAKALALKRLQKGI